MFCKNCGQQLENGSTGICSNCGLPTNTLKEQSSAVQQSAYSPPSVQQPIYPYPPVQPAYQPQQYQQPVQAPVKKKKKHGCLIALLVVVLLVGLIIASAAIFIPGLLRPYNLGVESSEEAYESAMQKFSYKKDSSPKQGELEDYEYIYGEPQPVDISLTSEEIASFLNFNRPSYYAIKNVQFRINDDDTVEASATLNVAYVLNYMLEGKYTKDDAQKELPMLGLIPANVNIYSKFSGKVEDNAVEEMAIDKVSILGITIPENLYSRPEAATFIIDAINDNIQKAVDKSNGSVDLLEVQDGKLLFQGAIPSSLQRDPAD